MKKLLKILDSRSGELSFSLASGIAYFLVVLQMIRLFAPGSMLLGFYFSPAIICGVALVLIKALRAWKEQELFSKILILFWVHILLMLIALLFLAEMLFL